MLRPQPPSASTPSVRPDSLDGNFKSRRRGSASNSDLSVKRAGKDWVRPAPGEKWRFQESTFTVRTAFRNDPLGEQHALLADASPVFRVLEKKQRTGGPSTTAQSNERHRRGDWAPAVNVQAWCFGNMNDDSGLGGDVHRNRRTGTTRFLGELPLPNAQARIGRRHPGYAVTRSSSMNGLCWPQQDRAVFVRHRPASIEAVSPGHDGPGVHGPGTVCSTCCSAGSASARALAAFPHSPSTCRGRNLIDRTEASKRHQGQPSSPWQPADGRSGVSIPRRSTAGGAGSPGVVHGVFACLSADEAVKNGQDGRFLVAEETTPGTILPAWRPRPFLTKPRWCHQPRCVWSPARMDQALAWSAVPVGLYRCR